MVLGGAREYSDVPLCTCIVRKEHCRLEKFGSVGPTALRSTGSLEYSAEASVSDILVTLCDSPLLTGDSL